MSFIDVLTGLKGAEPKPDATETVAAETDVVADGKIVTEDEPKKVEVYKSQTAGATIIKSAMEPADFAMTADAEDKIRADERQRIKSILTHENASANPDLAAGMAWGDTICGEDQAGKMLANAGGRSGLDAAMRNKSPKVGANTVVAEPENRLLAAAKRFSSAQ